MTHTYNITGMTCNGCVNGVKNKLQAVPGIENADVQLTEQQAVVTMHHHIPTATLQAALGTGKYTIIEATTPAPAMAATAAIEEEKKSYYPIFLIFGYIAGATLLIQLVQGSFNLMQWMTHFMAGFFLVFSFFKLLNINGFVMGYSTYDIIARKVPAYGYVYPFIELALGIALITGYKPVVVAAVTLVVMGISSIGVIESLLKKRQFECACLGTIIQLPLSKVTLFEDLLMVTMSAGMLVALLQ